MTFLEYMHSGGAIMWIILALSVIALAVVIERIAFFARAWTDPETLEVAFGRAMASGDTNAVREAAAGGSSMHRLFTAAYTHWMIGQEDLKLLVEQQVRRELYRWEKNLPILEIIARVSPLLGLLGTVMGMVQMFGSMHLGGSGADAVTGGIWKALFTTVAGLAVAIPVIIAHGMLASRIDVEEETLQRGGDFLLREHFASRAGVRRPDEGVRPQ